MPASSKVSFLFRGMKGNGDGIGQWLRRLLPHISNPDDPGPRREFEQLSKLILKHNTSPSVKRFSDGVLEDTARGLVQIGDFKSFCVSIRLHKGEVSSSI